MGGEVWENTRVYKIEVDYIKVISAPWWTAHCEQPDGVSLSSDGRRGAMGLLGGGARTRLGKDSRPFPHRIGICRRVCTYLDEWATVSLYQCTCCREVRRSETSCMQRPVPFEGSILSLGHGHGSTLHTHTQRERERERDREREREEERVANGGGAGGGGGGGVGGGG